MKLNNKTLRQLRRALRREATYLVKFRKKILDGGLEDYRRWKSWVRGTPPAVRQLLAAAEVLDDIIRLAGHTDVLGSAVTRRHASKRKRRSPAPFRNVPSAQHLRVIQ
jgi:hypothetical protein